MVNLSELKDELELSKVGISGAPRNGGFFVNSDLSVKFGGVDGCKDESRLRSLFDQILSIFLEDLCVKKHVYRPFPPKLGDGQDVDLFKLFWAVRRRGGYDSVSKNGECGLEVKLRAPLKLIYFKYLKEFDECLSQGSFKDKNFGSGKIDVIGKFELFSHELERYRCSTLEFNGNGGGMDQIDDEKRSVKDDKRIVLRYKNVANKVLKFDSNNNVNVVEMGVGSQKRNREEEYLSVSKTLNCNRSNGILKWDLLAKDGLFARWNVDSGNEAFDSEKNPKMHPVIYNDDKAPIHLSPKRKRCSQRLRERSTLLEAEKSHQIPNIIEIQDENPERTTVKVGPRFQAEVPEWTGVVFESDPKWLGTPMWPFKNDAKNTMNLEEIGQGRRQSSCECLFPGSADCVRFHIAENRFKVKRSLGPLFYKWKFNIMGEEVSLSWSPAEEDEFKSLVMKARQEFDYTGKSKHRIMKRFWRRASKSIPAKNKENLVSYYFNVFVLRRRSYQNRVMPEEIDSDDDEHELGLVGDRYGYERICGLTLNVKCSKNMQCTDFES